MRFLTILRVALSALRRNKTRSVFAMLGIIIGVGAVITMVSLGTGASAAIQREVEKRGTAILNLKADRSTGSHLARFEKGNEPMLLPGDYEAIRRECDAVKYVSPVMEMSAQVVYGEKNWSTPVRGFSADYLGIRDWPLAAGEYFSPEQEDAAERVCVIGQTALYHLFPPGVDPVGEVIRIRHAPFRVIGVLSEKGQNASGADEDDVIIIPWTTLQKKLRGFGGHNRINHMHDVLLSAASPRMMGAARAQVRGLIRQRWRVEPGEPDFFEMRDQSEMVAVATSSSNTMTMLLSSIALISLIVGGIGVMNIMLVSVTERTREIGIRMAVGARDWNIRVQFLTEAVILCVFGGLIGVMTGVAGARVISATLGWPTLVSADAVLLAFSCSAAVGIFFGFYPAFKASQLDPIDALRYS